MVGVGVRTDDFYIRRGEEFCFITVVLVLQLVIQRGFIEDDQVFILLDVDFFFVFVAEVIESSVFQCYGWVSGRER